MKKDDAEHRSLIKVLNAADAAVAVCNLKCIILEASSSFERMVGIATGAGKGFPLLQAAAPESLEGILSNVRRACSGETKAFVFRQRSACRATGSLMMLAVPIKHQGTTTAILYSAFSTPAVFEDDHGPHDFYTVFESLSEGGAILDAKGLIRRANPAFQRITGLAVADVVGKAPTCLPGAPDIFKQARSVLARDGFWHGEIQGVNARGEALFLLASLSLMSNGSEKPVSLLLFSDVFHQHTYMNSSPPGTGEETLRLWRARAKECVS